MAETELHVAGALVDLEVPDSLAARYDVLVAAGISTHRAASAALGLCWPKLGRKLRRAGVRYAGDVSLFGGAVFDLLLSEGGTIREIYAAGGRAIELCADGLPGSDDQEDAAGNSDGGEG